MSGRVIIGQLKTSNIAGLRFDFLSAGIIFNSDLNGDGFDDILVTGGGNYPPGSALVARVGFLAFGVVDGFDLATPAQFPTATTTNVHVRWALFNDFNGDGVRDVYLADHGYDAPPFPGQQNRLILSIGSAGWRDATGNLPQRSDFTHSAAAGDVNGDGFIDILAGNGGPIDAYLLLNDGTGQFRVSTDLLPIRAGEPFGPDGGGLMSCQFADLDGDGLPELLMGMGNNLQTPLVPSKILWNKGGSYADADFTPLPLPATFGRTNVLYDMQPVDINFDGRLDLVLAYQRDVWDGGWELQVLINQGDRTFTDETSRWFTDTSALSGGIPNPGGTGFVAPWIEFLQPRDLNGDGRLDFFIESNSLGGPRAPGNFPIALIHQEDGRLAPITVADLRAAGVNDNQLWGIDYAARGLGQPAELVSLWDDAGVVKVIRMSIEFAASSTNWVPGTAGRDVLSGTNGNDRLAGFGGDDVLGGGGGIDTATFSGNSSEYLVTFDPLNSTYSVKDTVKTRDGTDRVIAIENLQFSDGTKQLATTDALLVGRVNQAIFGKAPSSTSFNDSLIKAGPNGNTLEWVKTQASAVSNLSDAAYATLVLNNINITNTSLFATPTFGTPQQAYDALHAAMTDYLGLVGNASRGIVAAQLADIIAGFEGETVYGVYGGAAKAFNQQVGSNIAHSINNANTADIIAAPVMATGSASATGNNFSFMLAMGNYAYEISGFGTGDKIIGPTGATASLTNTNAADGSASLQYTANGQTVLITLTGLTPAQDMALTGIGAINTLFGIGALG